MANKIRVIAYVKTVSIDHVFLVWVEHGECLSGRDIMGYLNSPEVHSSGCEWCNNLKIRIMSRTGMKLELEDKDGERTVEKQP